ncbi:MAG: NAD(P)-dependent alcohol dehydrogenase [Kofleriaceae bacterium]|nr:NAD(P)-dependent alcohol dehydrogenase [Kofleriaceae bacterium]MCL4228080.1 NAD(P)-dependent alcohol dehydrogenase [Myxococcales bacterium]
MKAAVHARYGPPEVLRVDEVATPVPAANELLVRVRYSSVNRTDCGFLRARPFITRLFSGLLRPRHTALGCEFAGRVEAVGGAVTRFAVGDAVFGFDDARWGGHAQYKVIAEDRAVVKTPDGITDEQAAVSSEGAHYALVWVRALKVRPGQRVLVHGATGAIGSAAVQLLRHAGAHVVATSTTRNVELVRGLGAERVIDHEREDFTRCGETFDVVFDAVGKSSFAACRRLLVRGGIYVSTELGTMAQNPLLALFGPLCKLVGARRVLFPIPSCTQADLEFLRDRLARGELRPVIDRVYPLDDIVSAFRYVETGQKTGNVVIRIA